MPENYEDCISLILRTRKSKKPSKMLVRKWKHQVAPAMPCKIMKNCGSGGSNKIKTRLACILEASESTRMRMEETLPKYHEDHIAGKVDNSLQLTNLFLCLKQ